jgi:hypothetical protein
MTAVADPRWRLDRVASGHVYLSDEALMARAMEGNNVRVGPIWTAR